MAAALLAGNVLIYVPGLLWLGYLIANGMFDPTKYASVWDQTLAWGLTPFLIGDALKLALAAPLVSRPLEARRQPPAPERGRARPR